MLFKATYCDPLGNRPTLRIRASNGYQANIIAGKLGKARGWVVEGVGRI